MKTIQITSLDNIAEAAKEFIAQMGDETVYAFNGEMGAGKTTFTKGIGIALDIKRVINSPTFTIVKEYHGKYDLYHLDLYRLDGLGDDFDLEEYFTSNGICVCEWPYNIEEILPSEYLKIDIYREEADKRRFELTPIGNRYEQIVRDLNAQFNY